MPTSKDPELRVNTHCEPAIIEGPYLTVEESASYLRTSPGAIRNLAWKGTLPSYKPQRRLLFKKTDLDQFVESSMKGGWYGR